MASTRAHNRLTLLAAALAAASFCSPLCDPAGALTAGAGGTAAAGAALPAAAAPSSAAVPARPRGIASTPSAHVTSVRITSVRCTPAPRCSGNPRQVSVHGTLALTGRGLAAGMIVAFPRSPGARISRNSPGSRLRSTGSSLIVT